MIGGVQDDQFTFNSTKKNYFSKPNMKKTFKKNRFKVCFSKLDTVHSIVLPNECFETVFAFSVTQPKKKYLPFEVFISIG